MLEPKNLPQITEREHINISLAYIFLYFEKKIFKLSRKNINIFNSTCNPTCVGRGLKYFV